MSKIEMSSEITVEEIRAFANDAWVEEAARTSTQSEIRELAEKAKTTGGLIRRLMADRHGSPFEFGGWFVFRVQAPIMVIREWQRHRIGWSYNEQSGRYTEFLPRFYTPHGDRPLTQVGKAMDYHFEPGDKHQRETVGDSYETVCRTAWTEYQRMLGAGVAKEVARGVLPVSTFSTMYAAANPRTIMNFLSLRTEDVSAAYASHPMWEIHVGCARKIETILGSHMPITHKAFHDSGRVAP